jgi:hypothetical protein
MGNSNEELNIQPKEVNRPYTKNMFTVPFGDKYARAFHNLFFASISEQDEIASKIETMIKEDKSLTDIQRNKLNACLVAYHTASCENQISVPIIAFMKNHKPNIAKFMKDNRLKRVVSDLYDLFYENGFEYEVAYFPQLLQQFEYQYTDEKNLPKLNGGFTDECTFQIMVLVMLGRFARNLKFAEYASKFYVMMFMQKISQLTYLPTEVLYENEKLKDSIINILKTIYIIQRLELKRSGVIDDEEKVKEAAEA